MAERDMPWDLRQLRHKKPCSDCPFKKESLPGWMGGFSLDSYAQPPSVGMPTSCHQADFGSRSPKTTFCAGSCAVIANDAELERHVIYPAVDEVGPREDCFPSVEAFVQHHQEMHRKMSYRGRKRD